MRGPLTGLGPKSPIYSARALFYSWLVLNGQMASVELGLATVTLLRR